jgi:hypothetical protein
MTTTPTTPQFEQGDLFWAFVPFASQPAQGVVPSDPQAYLRGGFWGKNRPVVIVSVAKHNRADEIHVAMVTSNITTAQRRGEYVLKYCAAANLSKASAIRPRLFQVVKLDLVQPIGKLHVDDLAGLQAMLKDLLGI